MGLIGSLDLSIQTHESQSNTDTRIRGYQTVCASRKVSALSMKTKMAPFFCVNNIRQLLACAGGKGKGDTLVALETLCELFCGGSASASVEDIMEEEPCALLPDDRKLAFFSEDEQVLNKVKRVAKRALEAVTAGEGHAVADEQGDGGGDSNSASEKKELVTKLLRRLRLCLYLEDSLKVQTIIDVRIVYGVLLYSKQKIHMHPPVTFFEFTSMSAPVIQMECVCC